MPLLIEDFDHLMTAHLWYGDPFRVKRPVSEGRMARPTPFETKRKKAPIGALGRIQYLNVAEGMGLSSNLLWLQRSLEGPPSSPTGFANSKGGCSLVPALPYGPAGD